VVALEKKKTIDEFILYALGVFINIGLDDGLVRPKLVANILNKKIPSIENKLLIYKAAIKPIRSCGTELWGCASQSNTVIRQRSQSKIPRAIANAPRYVTNHMIHRDFNIRYVSDVIHERIHKHHIKLETQPNPLLEPLVQTVNTRKLKRHSKFYLR
jgi:hypothetical protein